MDLWKAVAVLLLLFVIVSIIRACYARTMSGGRTAAFGPETSAFRFVNLFTHAM
jgi:hypothetical protein